MKYIDPTKKSALLRFSIDNAKIGADELSANGVEYTYIPQTPIAKITTDTAWLYSSIAKYVIIEKDSAYNIISEIPVKRNETCKIVSNIKRMLSNIEQAIIDKNAFYSIVDDLAVYLGIRYSLNISKISTNLILSVHHSIYLSFHL